MLSLSVISAACFYGCCLEFFPDPLSLYITNRPPGCASKVSFFVVGDQVGGV